MNPRRRHFLPPSEGRLLFVLLRCFDVSYKDLKFTEEAEQRKLRRHLHKGCLTDEDTAYLVKGFQKAEGICSESVAWPPWFSHHLSRMLYLYKVVLDQLPKGTRVMQKDFLRFMVFNLAAPLGASALNRFHLISKASSPILMGHFSMVLLGLNSNPIPLSSKERDLPFATAIRSLRRAKLLKNVLKGQSPYKRHLLRWMKGEDSPDADALKGCLGKIEVEVKQVLREKSEKYLLTNVYALRKCEEMMLSHAHSRQENIRGRIQVQITKAEKEHGELTTDALFSGLYVRLRFLAGVQRVLILAKEKMGNTLYNDLLGDLAYWFHAAQNDRDLRCDGTWVEQPDRIVVSNREIHISNHIDSKTKRHLDWLARYGDLQEEDEATDYAQYWAHCLSQESATKSGALSNG